jgi:hypothetical protein
VLQCDLREEGVKGLGEEQEEAEKRLGEKGW